MSDNRAGHIALHRHADFIECACGHLCVTDSDFVQHIEQMDREFLSRNSVDRQPRGYRRRMVVVAAVTTCARALSCRRAHSRHVAQVTTTQTGNRLVNDLCPTGSQRT